MWHKIWKIILIIIIIIIAIFFPAILAFIGELLATAFPMMAPAIGAIAFGAIPWYVGAAVGIGLAYVLDPGTTTEIIHDAGDVVGVIGTEVVDTVGGLAGHLLSTAAPLLIGVGLLWYFFIRKKDDVPPPYPPLSDNDTLSNDSVTGKPLIGATA